jgi:hypothetical protein
MNTSPRTAPELRTAAWEMAGDSFRDLDAAQARRIEELVIEAYRRGRLDEENPGSRDNDGIDRRTYERPNCGSKRKHDQHFHNPGGLKNFILNCPGSFGPAEE